VSGRASVRKTRSSETVQRRSDRRERNP